MRMIKDDNNGNDYDDNDDNHKDDDCDDKDPSDDDYNDEENEEEECVNSICILKKTHFILRYIMDKTCLILIKTHSFQDTTFLRHRSTTRTKCILECVLL